jgi:putative ABC transport system permease protein
MNTLILAAQEIARFAPVAIAATVAFRVANFPDLGLEGAFLIGGALTVAMSNIWHISYWTAPIVLVVGAAMGTMTAVLYLSLRIHPLFAGIFTLMVAKSGGSLLVGKNASLGDGALYSTDYVGLVVGLATALLLILFFSTRVGITFAMAGSSPRLLVRLGRSPNSRITCLLATASAIAALGGHVAAGIVTSAPRASADLLLVKTIGWILMGEAIVIMAWRFAAIFHRKQKGHEYHGSLFSRLSAYFSSCGLWYYFLASLCGLSVYQLIFVFLLKHYRASEETEMIFAVGLAAVLFAVNLLGKRSIPFDSEWHFLGMRTW